MKVLLAAGDEKLLEELRGEFPQVEILRAEGDEAQKRLIKDVDVLYGWLDRETFLAADRLRWIQRTGTGIDKITDVPELIDSDVILTNARDYHAYPMADHVFAMVLALAHNLKALLDAQRAHSWDAGKKVGRFVDLRGKNMGILALGAVGMAVASRAHGFGMQVYGVDLHPKPPTPELTESWGMDRLDDVLSLSDWFVVTAPLTPDTRDLIDRRRVGLLKKGAYVVVISRGNIVDEDALIDALRSGHLAGAGLDVMATEPLPEDSPLWEMENVILSPHISSNSPDSHSGRQGVFKENLRRFLNNEPFIYVCDKVAGF